MPSQRNYVSLLQITYFVQNCRCKQKETKLRTERTAMSDANRSFYCCSFFFNNPRVFPNFEQINDWHSQQLPTGLLHIPTSEKKRFDPRYCNHANEIDVRRTTLIIGEEFHLDLRGDQQEMFMGYHNDNNWSVVNLPY